MSSNMENKISNKLENVVLNKQWEAVIIYNDKNKEFKITINKNKSIAKVKRIKINWLTNHKYLWEVPIDMTSQINFIKELTNILNRNIWWTTVDSNPNWSERLSMYKEAKNAYELLIPNQLDWKPLVPIKKISKWRVRITYQDKEKSKLFYFDIWKDWNINVREYRYLKELNKKWFSLLKDSKNKPINYKVNNENKLLFFKWFWKILNQVIWTNRRNIPTEVWKAYLILFWNNTNKEYSELKIDNLKSANKVEKINNNDKFWLLPSGWINIPFKNNNTTFSWIIYWKKWKILLKQKDKNWDWINGRKRNIKKSYNSYSEFKNDIIRTTNKKFKKNRANINNSYLALTFNHFFKKNKKVENTIIHTKLEKRNSNEWFYILNSWWINIPTSKNETIVLYWKYNWILFMKKNNNKWNMLKKINFPNTYQYFDDFYENLTKILKVENKSYDEIKFKKYTKLAFKHFKNVWKLRREKIQMKIDKWPTNPWKISIIWNKPYSKAYKWEYISWFLFRFWLRWDSYSNIFLSLNKDKFWKDNWLGEWINYELPIYIEKISKWKSISWILNNLKLPQIFVDKIFKYNKKYNTKFENISNPNRIPSNTTILVPRWETWFYQSTDLQNIIKKDKTKPITTEEAIGKKPKIKEDITKDENEPKILELNNTSAEILYYNDEKAYNISFKKKNTNILIINIESKQYTINISWANIYLDKLWGILNKHFWDDRYHISKIAGNIYKSLFPKLSETVNNRQELKDFMYKRNFDNRVVPFFKYSKTAWYSYPIIKSLTDAKWYEKKWYLKKYEKKDFKHITNDLKGVWHGHLVKSEYLFLTEIAYNTISTISRKIKQITGKDAKIRSMFRPKIYNNKIPGSSPKSPHQSWNAFDIWFPYYKYNKKKIYQILKIFDTQWLIILTNESDHFHITVTNPDIRNRFDAYKNWLTKNKIEVEQYRKKLSSFKKEELIAEMEPVIFLEWEENRNTFRLWKHLEKKWLPESSLILMKDLMRRYMSIQENKLPNDKILESRINIMIRFILDIESSGWKLNTWNTQWSSAKWPFQFIDWFDANWKITQIKIKRKWKESLWINSHNRNKSNYSPFDIWLRSYIKYITWDTGAAINLSDNRIPKHILIAYENPWTITPIDFSAEQSINFWLVNIFNERWSNSALNKLLIDWDSNAMKILYIKHHHKGKTTWNWKNIKLKSVPTQTKINNVYKKYSKIFS